MSRKHNESLIIKDLSLDRFLSVKISIFFAKEVLHIFEDKYPSDMRPRKAIAAAEAWLKDPSADASAYAAAYSAYAAAYAASTADAAYAASTAAYAASTAYSAASTAYKNQYIHNRIIKLLPFILEYKIENKQSFKNSEKVFEYLNDENKEKFLFNLDIL